MKKPGIYFVSAPRGMWCDFVAHVVSRDQNFYDLPIVKPSTTNKWNTGTVLPVWSDQITFDLKAAFTPEQALKASQEAVKILNTYDKKHLIIQSHYCDDPLHLHIPRILPIRIVSDPHYYPLFFILGIIKAGWDATGLCGKKPSLLYLCEYTKIKNPFTFIEMTWHTNFLNPPYKGNYTELDITDPLETHIRLWNVTFDVAHPIDCALFENKWKDDIQLVENVFGRSYNSILNSDWKRELKAMTFDVLLPHMDKPLLKHYYS